jgi:hypothetical protein
MNTIGLLLVLGLAFFALKQKSEKTRNMLLIASALLGFCMFSAEGFATTPDDWAPLCTAGQSTPDGLAATTGDQSLCNAVTNDTECAEVTAGLTTGVTCKWGILTQPANIISSASPTGNGLTYTFPVGFNVTTGVVPAGTTITTDATGADACTVTQIPTDATGILSADTVANIYPCGDADAGTPDGNPALYHCNCLQPTVVKTDGLGENNIYCNSGWLAENSAKYMDDTGTEVGSYGGAHTCSTGPLSVYLGDFGFPGKCTAPKDATACLAAPAV